MFRNPVGAPHSTVRARKPPCHAGGARVRVPSAPPIESITCALLGPLVRGIFYRLSNVPLIFTWDTPPAVDETQLRRSARRSGLGWFREWGRLQSRSPRHTLADPGHARFDGVGIDRIDDCATCVTDDPGDVEGHLSAGPGQADKGPAQRIEISIAHLRPFQQRYHTRLRTLALLSGVPASLGNTSPVPPVRARCLRKMASHAEMGTVRRPAAVLGG